MHRAPARQRDQCHGAFLAGFEAHRGARGNIEPEAARRLAVERERLKVGPGDSVGFVEARNGKIVVRSKSGTLGDMRGMLRGKASLPSPDAIEGWVEEARSRSWAAARKLPRKSR